MSDRSEYETVALTPMRRMIAARMVEAKQTIPHFRLGASVETDRLEDLRRRYAEEGKRVSLNDLIVKACALALIEVPDVNVQWAGNAIHRFAEADIAVVTTISGGLTTPIIRSANRKPVPVIGQEVRALGVRAAKNELRLDEIIGGTFGISNLGMYGVEQFDAIINPPQCAMLAVGQTIARVVAGEAGSTRIATVMQLTLSVDHRAIDGATAASFLTALKRHLETPVAMEPAGECS